MADITITGVKSSGDEFKTTIKEDARTLHLVRKKLSSIDLSPLKDSTNLQRIILNANLLPSIDLSPLAECDKLRILHLGKNLFSSLDLTPLDNCQLESFFINHNQFSSIDLSPLRTWNKLQRLELQANLLTSIDLSPLETKNMIIFDLSYNQLTSIDLSPLKNSNWLRDLMLFRNKLSTIDVTPLVNSMRLEKFIIDPDVEIIASNVYVDQKLPKPLKKIQSKITWYLSDEEKQRLSGEIKIKILRILNKITPGIPTQLDRIAELSEQDEDVTEEFIKITLNEHPNLGRYHDFEQVFIKGHAVQDEIDKLLKHYEEMDFNKDMKI
ncbi:MAG: hypothetical protein ACTSP4_15990 [Candidatus Hodarchaeales archaeon]